MSIFVYELMTSGLAMAGAGLVAESMLHEGRAMLTALTADFVRAGQDVIVVRDERWVPLAISGCQEHVASGGRQVEDLFSEFAARADWTVVIAPELSGRLAEFTRRTVAAGGRLLGPDLETVLLASDKHATAGHLAAQGVPVPQGRSVAAGEPLPADFSYPAVLKPRDGAGSLGVGRVDTHRGPCGDAVRAASPSRLERYCPGLPVSVALLCGAAGRIPLPPCRQRLSDDGTFAYLGGETPLPEELARRATALACRAVATLPAPRGYVGVDLVLGPGAADYVIEVNPRLTTSYVGLRALCRENLALAMLEVAQGRSPTLSFHPGRVEFEPDGRVRRTV